jgi:hypothetical protein
MVNYRHARSLFSNTPRSYEAHGFTFAMIGGTSRDYLLGIPYADYDFVTDATPDPGKSLSCPRLNIPICEIWFDQSDGRKD